MDDTDWTTEETASLDRIPKYSVRDYNANDALDQYGFGEGGYLYNQMRQASDVQIIGRAARRFATFASSQTILAAQEAATATAERKAAQNAATNAYSSAGEAARQVGLAAAEVTKAGAKADLAAAEAERARRLAQTFKLPEPLAADAGKWLRWNGDAWELGEITIATADQIKTGTGKGFVNAETLGPLLQDVTTTAIKAYPVGSYMLRMSFAPDPGPNWLECLGQIVPLASYPDLATVLPAYVRQLGEQNIGNQPTIFLNGSSGSNFAIVGQWFEGNKLYALQNGFLTIVQPDGTQVQGTFANIDGYLWYTTASGTPGGNVRPILRQSTNEIFYRRNGVSLLNSIDASSVAAIQNGGRSSVFFGEAIAGATYSEFFFRLPNDVLLFFGRCTNGNNEQYTRCVKLPVGNAHNAWVNFDPGPFNPASSTTVNVPNEFYAWQAKDGYVYAITRPRGQSVPYTIYRTLTGASWSVVGSFTLASGAVLVGEHSRRRESKIVKLSTREESPDGKSIVVNLGNYAFLITTDGGATWVTKTVSELLNKSGDGLKTITLDPLYVGFAYDRYKNEWVFSCPCSLANSTQAYVNFWTGPDPLNLTTGRSALLTGYTWPVPSPGYQSALIITKGRYRHSFSSASGNAYGFVDYPKASAGVVTVGLNGTQSNIMPAWRFEGSPFDGMIWSPGNANGFAVWQFADDSEEIVARSANSSRPSDFTQAEFGVSDDGTVVTNVSRNTGNVEYSVYGSFYSYNPALERRLPTAQISQQSGAFAISESYRSQASRPRIYMKVK